MPHNQSFKFWANYVNKKLNTNITVTKSHDEVDNNLVNIMPPFKYKVMCTHCNQIIARFQRKSKVVKYPQNYRCVECHSDLTVYELINNEYVDITTKSLITSY